jgi:LysM repeat protein
VSILIALLGLGFGLLQVLNHPDVPAQAMAPISTADTTTTTLTAATIGAVTPLTAVNTAALTTVPAQPATREITGSVKVLEPNYTIAAGDTLGQIAARFNTTVDRIQALNNLSDPRALRIGTKLVVPPPF